MRLTTTCAVLCGLLSGATAQLGDAAAAAAASSASAYASSVSASNAAVAAAASSKNAAAAAAAAGTTVATAAAATAATATAAGTTTTATAAVDSSIVGTWVSKSNKTVTGPGFYNPVTDVMIEPERTGISYSFTADGFFEMAYYRAISNPTEPDCPEGIMQWQHGSFIQNSTGSLILTPIAVDGRQLLSEPCLYDNAIYTRWNQTITMEKWSYEIDPYHNIPRLNLYEFDGTPMMPLYLMYNPPVMLPTITLNPTTSATATATSTAASKFRRALGLDREVPVNYKQGATVFQQTSKLNADRWWWAGLTMTGVGGLLYFGPRRMGL